MKKLILFTLILLSSCINPQEATNKAKVVQSMADAIAKKYSEVPQLTIEDFQKDYAKDDNTILVDVRTEEEQKVSIIPGAISRQNFEANRARFKGKTIVTYCTIGQRSTQYAKSLMKAGHRAFNLKESILGWAQRGLPVVTLSGEATKKVHVYGEAWNLLPKEYRGVWEE